MLASYASAALICAASLLVGRALLSLAGQPRWTWLEPAIGFAALIAAAGLPARGPGHATTSALVLVLLIVAAAVVVTIFPPRAPDARRGAGEGERDVLLWGLLVAIAAGVILSIPFAISGRWGLLGVGLNNDLGLHLAWAEWLRSGFGPAPETGYPLGPHALADTAAAVPGVGLGQAFVGEIIAIGILTALTALAALPGLGPARRILGAVLVAVSYLAASYYVQGAFKETAEALFVLAVALALRNPMPIPRGTVARIGYALPWLAIAGGVFFAYSFAGLAWPIAVVALWSLTVPAVRRALAPRSLIRFLLRPLTLVCLVVVAGVAVLTVVGPFGFGTGFNRVAGSNTYGPVSPVEALGVWWAADYRLDAPGAAALPWLAAAIGGAAVAAGAIWWVRRRDLAVPIAFAACAVLYFASLPFTGDYSRAKALMIAAPLAMLVAVRPLLAEFTRRAAWTALAIAFVGGAAYSSFIVLRDGPVGPPGHGTELQSFLPFLHGKPVLYAGQDRYAAYELLGADTHVPLVEFPDPTISPNPEKPFDTGDAYSPIDFDSFTRGTLDRFPYVITGRAAWNSQAPPSFRRIAATPSFILWERVGEAPKSRRVLLEGTNAGGVAGCDAPEIRILLSSHGRAAIFPPTVFGAKTNWSAGDVLRTGESTAQTLGLPAGRWRLSLQYFSPFGLTLAAPGFHHSLEPALDGQRPNTISLANDGQFWPAGEIDSDGGRVRFTVAAADPSTLQRLSGYDGSAHVGNLVAVRAGGERTVPLSAACDRWIDWYEALEIP
ncbi:MAG TPA: hypothetical protein VH476_11940 [Solirubrobacterales bacterium]